MSPNCHASIPFTCRTGGEIVSEPFETIEVNDRTVACDGGKGPLGHPRVFLTMDEKDEVTCTYCSRHYVLSKDAKVAAH